MRHDMKTKKNFLISARNDQNKSDKINRKFLLARKNPEGLAHKCLMGNNLINGDLNAEKNLDNVYDAQFYCHELVIRESLSQSSP